MLTYLAVWLTALVPTVPAPVKPKLVVMITVDQLRPDYFTRWQPQLVGGLGMLQSGGAVFTNAFQDHALTETAPGHSTVLSGRWPAHTGIISNAFGVARLDCAVDRGERAGRLPTSLSRYRLFRLAQSRRSRQPGAVGVAQGSRGDPAYRHGKARRVLVPGRRIHDQPLLPRLAAELGPRLQRAAHPVQVRGPGVHDAVGGLGVRGGRQPAVGERRP